jgi:hypothetical protein
MMKAKVFLDTTALLTGFACHKTGKALPKYITDLSAIRYTFEKCVYEAYMAFRGVGGKKPDEGRQRWAEQYLKSEDDPAPVGKLISKFHGGSKEMGHFWINQILEAEGSIDYWEERVKRYVKPEHQGEIQKHLEGLQGLSKERRKFELLCREFSSFLQNNEISRLSYTWLFDRDAFYSEPESIINLSPDRLNAFAMDTVFPSEDFEIVYAALRIQADIFVTDDNRLRTCAMSLGLNFLMDASRFCSGKEYQKKIQEWENNQV